MQTNVSKRFPMFPNVCGISFCSKTNALINENIHFYYWNWRKTRFEPLIWMVRNATPSCNGGMGCLRWPVITENMRNRLLSKSTWGLKKISSKNFKYSRSYGDLKKFKKKSFFFWESDMAGLATFKRCTILCMISWAIHPVTGPSIF